MDEPRPVPGAIGPSPVSPRQCVDRPNERIAALARLAAVFGLLVAGHRAAPCPAVLADLVFGVVHRLEKGAVGTPRIGTSAQRAGPVSLVAVVGSTQIAILFVMTLLLSGFFPRVLKERTDRKALITKAVAIALMVAGLLLLR